MIYSFLFVTLICSTTSEKKESELVFSAMQHVDIPCIKELHREAKRKGQNERNIIPSEKVVRCLFKDELSTVEKSDEHAESTAVADDEKYSDTEDKFEALSDDDEIFYYYNKEEVVNCFDEKCAPLASDNDDEVDNNNSSDCEQQLVEENSMLEESSCGNEEQTVSDDGVNDFSSCEQLLESESAASDFTYIDLCGERRF